MTTGMYVGEPAETYSCTVNLLTYLNIRSEGIYYDDDYFLVL